LDLVEHEQHVVLAAERARRGKVARRRNDDARLGLNRLDEKRDRVLGQRRAQRVKIAEVDELEARRERAEVLAVLRFGREADDRRRTAVKVVAAHDDLGTVVRHALGAITPLACELERGLDGFGPRVHRQCHVEPRQRA
jgi:hypothetical protein